jgi:hypothetical protein
VFRPGEYLNGVRVANVKLRPARPAYLVPYDNQDAAEDGRDMLLNVGGCASYIVPYSRSEGLTEGWVSVLKVLDPDALVAYGTLPEAQRQRLEERGWFIPGRGAAKWRPLARKDAQTVRGS